MERHIGTASARSLAPEFPIREVTATPLTIPTRTPESDGTLEWHETTIVLVQVSAGDQEGLGYTYSHPSAAALIRRPLSEVLQGQDALDIPGSWEAMRSRIRNLGRPGLCSTAISALDAALWDLKAKLLRVPLARLFGLGRPSVPVYGSGGFTSYTDRELERQLGGWVDEGIPRVKMKVGREPGRDPQRVRRARRAIGSAAQLFVDANGAYSRKQALEMAETFADFGVKWFEEPVSSDDLEGLRLLRDRAPAGMAVAAGEYGYDLPYFERMLEAGAVDVLQIDATRAGGPSEFVRAAALAAARGVPLSAHTAPSLHLPVCLSIPSLQHIEYFYDHVRIEGMLFEGLPILKKGALWPRLDRPGLGLELKRSAAARYSA